MIKEKTSKDKENRFERLYQQGAAKRSVNKNKQTQNDADNKDLTECTFKPQINNKK